MKKIFFLICIFININCISSDSSEIDINKLITPEELKQIIFGVINDLEISVSSKEFLSKRFSTKKVQKFLSQKKYFKDNDPCLQALKTIYLNGDKQQLLDFITILFETTIKEYIQILIAKYEECT